MQKPDAISHMMTYGFIYGLLLMMLYLWVFFIIGGVEFSWDELLVTIGLTAYKAIIFGAIPGSILGLFGGYILWRLTDRDIQSTYTQREFARTRILSFAIIGGLPLGITSLLSLLFDSVNSVLLDFLPAIVVSSVAVYATHRYMYKLRAWGNIGKIKNDYKPKNQLADTASADVDPSMISESDSQVNKLRLP